MRVSSKHVAKMLKTEISAIYGHSSGLCRLEWITQTGGSLNVPHDELVGATDAVNIENDVAGMWGPVMRDQRERVSIDGNMISIDQLGFVYFANDLNLQGRDKLVILQHVKDKYYTGAGTGAGSVWTPGTAPAWTADEWITYWLVFSDRRFKITDNAAGNVTVDLTSEHEIANQSLPASSTTAEIMRFVEWHPVRADPGVVAGALSPLNEQVIFQSVFVSRIPITGQV